MANEHELISCIGRDGLEAIQRRYQGSRMYVPKVMIKEHPLAQLIGLQAAKKLSDKHPASLFTITRSLLVRKRNSSIIKERQLGIAANDVALRYGLTARTVRNICQGELSKAGAVYFYGMRARMRRAAWQAGRGNGTGTRPSGESHG